MGANGRGPQGPIHYLHVYATDADALAANAPKGERSVCSSYQLVSKASVKGNYTFGREIKIAYITSPNNIIRAKQKISPAYWP